MPNVKNKTRRSLRNIHKWFGLIGGLWIIVLGFSGLMLDHRDDWGWAWRLQVPDSILPHHTRKSLENRHITLAQANPDNPDEWIVGGPMGVWQSANDAETWQRLPFEGLKASPMVFSLTLDQTVGWEKLWLATDDGLWSYKVGESVITREGLAGRYLTALDNGSAPGTLVAVENRTDILSWSEQAPSDIQKYNLANSQVSGLPEKVSLSRFLFDMHLGRSFFNRPFNMAVNDFGALAMIILAISGFLRWYYMKRWRGTKGPSLRKSEKCIMSYIISMHQSSGY